MQCLFAPSALFLSKIDVLGNRHEFLIITLEKKSANTSRPWVEETFQVVLILWSIPKHTNCTLTDKPGPGTMRENTI